ncbi:MAG: LysM protein [Patescibacteria group bacterium]|jgi:hypothetical protein|nr:LysM protein [Patescibacteria group bacterium]
MANVIVSDSRAELKTLIKQPETILGALMLCLLALMGWQTVLQAGDLLQSNISINQPVSLNASLPNSADIQSTDENLSLIASDSGVVATPPNATSSAVITDQEQTATPTASATPKPAATTNPVASPPVIPDTMASNQDENIVIARINDTFWDIARRTCGQGIQGYRIEEENGYTKKHLQPGDHIVVTCN